MLWKECSFGSASMPERKKGVPSKKSSVCKHPEGSISGICLLDGEMTSRMRQERMGVR